MKKQTAAAQRSNTRRRPQYEVEVTIKEVGRSHDAAVWARQIERALETQAVWMRRALSPRRTRDAVAADKRSPLTAEQRDSIVDLVATVTDAGRDRRAQFSTEIVAAGELYLGNRAADTGWIAAKRTRFQKLVRVLDELLLDNEMRLRLYVVGEAAAKTRTPVLHEFGCIEEKCRVEGVPLVKMDESSTPSVLNAYVAVYMEHACKPGPWVRDAARDLRDAAHHVLTRPPFRRDKIDDTREQFIRSVADAWEVATGRKPSVRNRGKGRGPFFDFVNALFSIVGDDRVSEHGLANRIRRALKRPMRGIYWSR